MQLDDVTISRVITKSFMAEFQQAMDVEVAIGGAGLVALYSAVSAGAIEPNIILFKRQLIWYGGGLVIMVGCFLFDYKQIERFANVIYLASVGSLMAVMLGKSPATSRSNCASAASSA